MNNLGLFLQDAWTIGRRLTLHLGLRTENEHVPSLLDDPRAPDTAMEFGFGDKLAPRLGFAWDASGDGKTKVYGSWGVFYDITKLESDHRLRRFQGARILVHARHRRHRHDRRQPGLPARVPGEPHPGPGELRRSPNDPDDNRIDPDVQQMRLQEAVVGVEREIAPNLSVSARYVHKQLDRALEDIGTTWTRGRTSSTRSVTPASVGPPLLPRGRDGARRSAEGERATTTRSSSAVNRRLSGQWSARASYTWSRLWGSYSGLAQSDEDGRVSARTSAATSTTR